MGIALLHNSVERYIGGQVMVAIRQKLLLILVEVTERFHLFPEGYTVQNKW